MTLYDVSSSRKHTRRIQRRRSQRSGDVPGPLGAPRKSPDERKDFLVQARVPRDLDDVLKREAKRRRLSVSHLIRNVLEDTYALVDGVIDEVDNLVQDSVRLGHRVRRDAKQLARSARARTPDSQPETAEAQPDQHAAAQSSFETRTADVYAWNPVVLHRAAPCIRCGVTLQRGAAAHMAVSDRQDAPPRWLCAPCIAAL